MRAKQGTREGEGSRMYGGVIDRQLCLACAILVLGDWRQDVVCLLLQ